jgi:hypothetical protein
MFSPVSGMSLYIIDTGNGGLPDTVCPVTGNTVAFGGFIYQTIVSGTTSGVSPTGGWCQTGPTALRCRGRMHADVGHRNNSKHRLKRLDAVSV